MMHSLGVSLMGSSGIGIVEGEMHSTDARSSGTITILEGLFG